MGDGLWLRYWLYQERLPRHPEPAEDEPGDRLPGLIDESN